MVLLSPCFSNSGPHIVSSMSAGGFLTCHVVGQHPDRFVAAVARNPGIDTPV